MHDGKKVFMLYDPPHLLKNVRNNMKKHGFVMGKDDILWDHLEAFFEADSSKPIRMAPKLTKNHISLPPFKSLRVYYAAQVLSHTVASGMSLMAQWNVIPAEANHTATFIETMDRLFNCFNSRRATSKAQYSHAMSETSGHKEFLVETGAWLKTIKTKGSRKPACLNGWEMGINCLLQLWEVLHTQYSFQFLLTSRLNQDCVDNLFSVIRGKGAGCDNPDARQFRAAFSQTMVDAVLTPGKNANCEEDVDDFLLNLGTIQTRTAPNDEHIFAPTSTLSAYDSLLNTLPASVRNIMSVCSFPDLLTPPEVDLSLQEENVIAYISGYIARKLRGHACQICAEKLIVNMNEALNESDIKEMKLEFVMKMKYDGAKDGLVSPSPLLVDAVSHMECMYRKVIDDTMYSDNVKATLYSKISEKVDLTGLYCDTCHVHVSMVHLLLNIRLHHTLKETNRGLTQDKDRKNRKILKFQHM